MNPELTAEQQQHMEQVLQGPQNLEQFIEFCVNTWNDGGWVMIPLFLLTVFIYFEAVALLLRLQRTGVSKVPESTWSKWLRDPSKGTGHVGDVVRYVTGGGWKDRESLLNRVQAVRASFIPRVNQRIVLLSVLVTIAPLMGLLGTVIGMLTTFKSLGMSGGQTVDLVAGGISVALITTQTGLMVAIPGYIAISWVIKKRNAYNAFLAALEAQVVLEQSRQASENHRESA